MFRHPSHQAPSSHRDPLLAVLPFRNLNADASSRYFSDGITQEIVDALLQTTEIRVAAPASSFALRDADPARTARVLGATHVLSGSVERHGSDLRVVAQLSDIASRRAIWSHIYRTTVAQTPGLQHHIAVQIANALDMRLPSRGANETAQVNPEAYDHYLRGRDLFRQRRDGPVALDELEKSVRLAPRFAKAWSTLAATRYLMASGSAETHGPMLKKAREAAKRALAIDPHNAEALGVLALSFEGNPLLQDRLFEQALRAEPNNTQLLNWHHNFLGAVGRTREAGLEIQRAYELDRLTPAVIWNYAFDLLENGDLAQARQIMDLAAENCSADEAFEARGQYLIAAHDWDGLSRHLQTPAARLQPQLATAFRLAEETIKARDHGDSTEFPRLRAEWHAIVTDDRGYPVRYLTLLGDTPGALRIVKESFTSAAPGYFTGVNNAVLLFVPTLPALRRDPGAKMLMVKLGLFEYWRASNHWPDFCDEPGLPFDCKAEARKLKS